MLNFAREYAIELFCKACHNCESICGTHPFEIFVHHAIYPDYQKVRHLLQFALHSDVNDAVENAARQIILAELGDVDVGSDASFVRSGSETMRKSAVGVYAHNISHQDVGDKCAEWLETFFNDGAESVRQEVSHAFSGLKSERLVELKDVIARYIESDSFKNETDSVLHSLEESNVELPDIICRAAERVLEFVGEEGTRRVLRYW